MRFLAILLFALAPHSNAAITLLAHAGAQGGNPTHTTPAITTTGASLLVLGLATYGKDLTTCTVTDSNANTWRHLANQPGNTVAESAIWYAWDKNGSALATGAGHTVSVTSCLNSNGHLRSTFAAYSGTQTNSDPFDAQNGSGSTTASTNRQPGSITPRVDNALVVTIVGQDYGSAYSINGGFTIADGVTSPALGTAQAYLVQTTAAPANPTWTVTGGSYISAAIASFLPAATNTTRRRIIH